MLLPVTVKIKKLHPDAVIPDYAKPGDAGLDLTAVNFVAEKLPSGRLIVSYDTGLSVEIPEGYVGLIFPRSSIFKKSLCLTNSVGVLDSGYRGEIKFKFEVTASSPVAGMGYELGERIGQLIVIPYPKVNFEEVEELSTTERGDGGFGSTGS